MMTKIPTGGSGISNRKGSCSGLVDYLEKEGAGLWFGHDSERLAGHEVLAAIDRNKANLSRDDDKYYQVIVAPSQAELAHLGNDPPALQVFTRAVMEGYARNFGKGIGSADLVWYAKIEYSRSYDHTDRAVQLGDVAEGTAKEGDQTHIHIIVSRTENLPAYHRKKREGLTRTEAGKDRKPFKLSPLTAHQQTEKGAVKGGFGRNAFSQATEQTFDRTFQYERGLTESFRFLHGVKYGDEQTKASLRLEASQQKQRLAPAATAAPAPLTPVMDYTPIRKPARVEQAPTGELRQQLGAAYRQQDDANLAAALARADALRLKQEQLRQAEKAAQTPTHTPPITPPIEKSKQGKTPDLITKRPRTGLRQ